MPLLDWFTKHRKVTISACAVILIVTFTVSITPGSRISKLILAYFADWSTALGAGAALLLLYVVYMTLLYTREMREQDRKRDSNRRQLDEILKWTQDLRWELLQPRNLGTEDYERELGLLSVAVRDTWVATTARTFDDDLHTTVIQAIRDLEAYIKQGAPTKHDTQDTLNKSVKNVLQAIYRIKTDQKL